MIQQLDGHIFNVQKLLTRQSTFLVHRFLDVTPKTHIRVNYHLTSKNESAFQPYVLYQSTSLRQIFITSKLYNFVIFLKTSHLKQQQNNSFSFQTRQSPILQHFLNKLFCHTHILNSKCDPTEKKSG
mmetsp:Transcript_10489/g.10560  ORF Transcript_10489/g.10560 Transcript_10489/m.10560 type:complete len:127 (-) Transcript_10489:17-397(-)